MDAYELTQLVRDMFAQLRPGVTLESRAPNGAWSVRGSYEHGTRQVTVSHPDQGVIRDCSVLLGTAYICLGGEHDNTVTFMRRIAL